MKLKQNSFETVLKLFWNCLETVLFRFHFPVRTVSSSCSPWQIRLCEVRRQIVPESRSSCAGGNAAPSWSVYTRFIGNSVSLDRHGIKFGYIRRLFELVLLRRDIDAATVQLYQCKFCFWSVIGVWTNKNWEWHITNRRCRLFARCPPVACYTLPKGTTWPSYIMALPWAMAWYFPRSCIHDILFDFCI